MAGRWLSVAVLAGIVVAANVAAGFLEPHVAPETFRTAEGLPGDRGVYGVQLVIASEGPGVYVDANAEFAFERLPDEALPGLGTTSVFLAEWSSGPFSPGAWGGPWGEDWEDAGPGGDRTGRGDGDWDGWGEDTRLDGLPWQVTHHQGAETVAATLRLDDARLPSVPAPVVPAAPGNGTATFRSDLPGPCGFAHDLQGRDHDLREPVQVHGQCPPPIDAGDTARTGYDAPRLRVSGEDRVDGARALVFSYPEDPDELRLWFVADNPYPVRILTRLSASFFTGGWGGADGPGGDVELPGFYALYELEHFERGAPATGPPAPETVLADATQVGPAEASSGLSFPLSAALDAARQHEDPAVRDFLAAHPAATVRQADHGTLIEDDGTAWSDVWEFVLGDDEAALDVRLERRHEPTGQSLLPVPVPGAVPPEDRMVLATSSAQVPAALPELLPDVPSMAAWAGGPGGGHDGAAGQTHDLDGHGWGFGPFCADLACTTTHQGLWWTEARTDARRSGTTVEPTATVFHQYAMDTQAAFLGRVDLPSPYPEPRYDGAAYEAGDASTPWDWDVASVGFWSFPEPKTVAAVSAGAVLLGALLFVLTGAKGIGAWGLFSRIREDRLLEHPGRQAIMDAVTGEPGLHFQALARRLGMGRGTLEHHLQKLTAADQVVARADGGFTCYFPKGGLDRRVMRAAPALKSPGGRKVLEAIVARPGLSGKELAGSVGMSPSTVHHHVKRLIKADLVATWRDGRSLRLGPGDRAEAALLAFGAPPAVAGHAAAT